MSTLEEAVTNTLDPEAKDRGFPAALELVRAEVGTERISLHVTSERPGYFSVIGSAGESILPSGTQLPIQTSSQVLLPAGGQIFQQAHFDRVAHFDLALDRLVTDMGFRSGCSIPLAVGYRTVAALCVTARTPELSTGRIVDVLMQASSPLTLALITAETAAPTRVLICHSDELIAEGIARIVEHSLATSVEVVTAPHAAIERVTSPHQRIDKIILDGLFADGQLEDFLRDLRAAGTRAPTLVIDSHASPLSQHLAVLGGAHGYIGRDAGSAGIVRALQTLGADDLGASHSIGTGTGEYLPAQQEHLTAQEGKLLQLLERGLRFKDIAAQMEICESTAKGYARNVFAKLGVHSRGEAVHEARQQGVLRHLRAGATTVPVMSAHEHRKAPPGS